MSNIRYKRGQLVEYISPRGFHMGGENSTVIKPGQSIWFDGYVMDLGDGVRVPASQLKKAVQVGWLVPANTPEEEAYNYPIPQTAPAQQAQQQNLVYRDRDVVAQVTEDPRQREYRSQQNKKQLRVKTSTPEQDRLGQDQYFNHAIATDRVENFFGENQRSPSIPKETTRVQTDPFANGAVTMNAEIASDDGVVLGSFEDFKNAGAPPKPTDASRDERLRLHNERVAAYERYKQQHPELEAYRPHVPDSAKPVGIGEVETVGEPEYTYVDAAPAPQARPLATKVSWDTSRHWRTRVKDIVSNYSHDQNQLNQILSVESEAVVRNVKKQLNQ